MKKILIFTVLVFSLAVACDTAEKTPADVASVMKDSSQFTTIQWLDSSIDFGTKKMGEVVNITFKCKNTGNKPLYLFNVRPSCGCTLVDYSKDAIAPGKEGKIDAQFNTKGHPGVAHKTITVIANTSNEATNTLRFSGLVLPSDSTTKN